jgi:hypothetical protein
LRLLSCCSDHGQESIEGLSFAGQLKESRDRSTACEIRRRARVAGVGRAGKTGTGQAGSQLPPALRQRFSDDEITARKKAAADSLRVDPEFKRLTKQRADARHSSRQQLGDDTGGKNAGEEPSKPELSDDLSEMISELVHTIARYIIPELKFATTGGSRLQELDALEEEAKEKIYIDATQIVLTSGTGGEGGGGVCDLGHA